MALAIGPDVVSTFMQMLEVLSSSWKTAKESDDVSEQFEMVEENKRIDAKEKEIYDKIVQYSMPWTWNKSAADAFFVELVEFQRLIYRYQETMATRRIVEIQTKLTLNRA
jgi:hypothetical protein